MEITVNLPPKFCNSVPQSRSKRMAFIAGICLFASAWLAGIAAAQSGGPIGCGTSGVLFQNSTSSTVPLELKITGNNANGTALSDFKLSWTDPSGIPRSATINGQASEGFAIALKTGATLNFSCPSGQAASWAIGGSGTGATTFECDSGTFLANGTLLVNDQAAPLNLLIDISGNQPNSKPISVTLSWTDPLGTPHSSSISSQFSKGVGITVGSGRQLTYACSTPVAGSWSAQPQ